MSSCCILRRRHSRVSKIFPDGMDSLSVQHIAVVVRPMQNPFDSIQPYPQTRAGQGLHRRSEVIKEGLNLPPMNVAARWLTKESANEVFVFVAHG